MGLRGLPRFEVSKALLFVEQVSIMCQKHISQRKRNGRQFLKDSIMIQFFTLAFIVFIINQASNYTASPHFYGRIPLPPLSKSATNGVFNEDAPGNLNVNSISQRLYYAPSNHAGVNALIDALIAVYPDVKAIGAADAADMNKIYENNLFDTWATLDFQLTANQLSSGRLIPSQSQVTDVSYTISVNPTIWGNLPTSNYSSPIYNNEVAPSDLFWSSGYLTLQNFVEEYLVQQYNGQGDFSVRETLLFNRLLPVFIPLFLHRFLKCVSPLAFTSLVLSVSLCVFLFCAFMMRIDRCLHPTLSEVSGLRKAD